MKMPEPKTIKDAILLVGVLGGYQNKGRARLRPAINSCGSEWNECLQPYWTMRSL